MTKTVVREQKQSHIRENLDTHIIGQTAIDLRRLGLTSARLARDTYVEMPSGRAPYPWPGARPRTDSPPVLDTVIPSPGSPLLPAG